MAQLEHIEAIERRLWGAADQFRANSNYASNEYFLPVMGLVFLRHAYSRYLAVKGDIEPDLPTRGGKTRSLTKEDFSQKSATKGWKEAQRANTMEPLTPLPPWPSEYGGAESNFLSVTLINGDKLIELLIEHGIGVKKRPLEVWDFDPTPFEDGGVDDEENADR